MPPGLCENCHKRSKCGTHKFCGRTCAAQAATKLVQPKQPQAQAKGAPRNAGRQKAAPAPPKAVQLCIQCGQNPKYNNFDYCGRSCAALASATRSPPTQGVAATVKHKARQPSAASSNAARAPAPAKAHKTPPAKVPVAQDDSTEEEVDEEDDDAVSTDLDAYPSDSGSESEEESTPLAPVSQPSAKDTSRSAKPGGGVQKIPPGICGIPGCGQSSHVDRKGMRTKYCSIKHREEAVKLGLEEACIMCQRYPQSTSDYFCSSACRNQSMTKT